ncbi:urease accessory protein UreD [Tautonia marina]|uniref:urease accessory protein UreD n=1 Tax=Tautonia marina TaxID=2653855 RepID=UPI001260B7BF|nr:urease accessory protein UreD [Tautonia marina]
MIIDAPELAPYQDEPKQLPSGSFGKVASLRLRFDDRGNRSILGFMDRRAPLLVQRALYCDEGMPGLPVVHIISNAGGILQGDRYTMEFVAGPGACGHITTQAATKIHEMDANYASQEQDIILEDGAYLEYLPDPVIPFRHSRFLSRTRIRIAPAATLLYAEILMAGRKYYREGERFQFDLFSSTVRANRPSGAELFVEKFVIEPARSPASRIGIMGDFDVFGNVILLTPREHADAIFDQVPALWDKRENMASGVSRLPNDAGLIYKILGMESGPVRTKVREFWSIVRSQVTGKPVTPEFPWR